MQSESHKLNAKYQFDRKMWNTIKHKFSLSHIKMGNEILKQELMQKSDYGQTKWMYFLIEKNYLLEKYNTIFDKSALISKKNFRAALSTGITF